MKSKNEIIIEIKLEGKKKKNKDDSDYIIEEIFDNQKRIYKQEITYYIINSNEIKNHIECKIELHKNLSYFPNQNINDNKPIIKYYLKKDMMYNNIDFMNKTDEYICYADYYIKYISNRTISSSIGTASVIEYSRCDENMKNVLPLMGYTLVQEKKRIEGFLYKYREYPIICIIYKPNEKSNLEIDIEIYAYCNEKDKNITYKILENIKKDLSSIIEFN